MSNENIIREIDEELRSDRMRKLWRNFGPYVIGAAVAIVLIVAVNEGMDLVAKLQLVQVVRSVLRASSSPTAPTLTPRRRRWMK